MKLPRQKRVLLAGIAVFPILAGATPALAQACFTAFGGSIHYQFTLTPAQLKAPGIRSTPGVVFGALAACAGQTHWPLVGTAVANNRVVVLGFRAMTVDAAGCGAVDEIAALNPTTLSGPFQLHNDRNNFSNTSTLTPAPCVAVPLLAAQAAPPATGQKDPAGNSAQ
jgi:hypothetical protein